MICKREKILLLIPSLAGGGAERFFCMLLEHLDRRRFELHVALFSLHGEYRRDVPKDVVIHDLKCVRARYAAIRLVRLIWKLQPRAVLSTLPQCNLVLTLSRPFLPRQTRILVRESLPPSTILPARGFRFWRALYRYFYGRADKIICLCDTMAEDIATRFKIPRDKLVRIYNPVDSQRVQDMGDAAANPYSGPGPHLVAVGRLDRQKGFDLLLSAMPSVCEAVPGVKLAILGQGPLRDKLVAQAQSLGLTDIVQFLGFQQNPWLFIRYADLFVLPSRYEGLPNALLEAMALHKPIVAADCPGAIGEIHAFNPAMVLVPPEDPDALARAIISKCKMRDEKSNLNGFSWSLERFSVQRIMGEYSDLLLG